MAKEVFSAGIVIFYGEGDERLYLVLCYPHGHWDFVKGKIEAGESKQKAALRELKEETGLESNIMPGFETMFSYDYITQRGEPAHKVVTFFVGPSSTMKVKLSHEHIDFAWLPYEQAKSRLTFNNAKSALDRAREFLD
jgi:8-oxo-dGTP pyrophosphatase MutT (NUDIX family)